MSRDTQLEQARRAYREEPTEEAAGALRALELRAGVEPTIPPTMDEIRASLPENSLLRDADAAGWRVLTWENRSGSVRGQVGFAIAAPDSPRPCYGTPLDNEALIPGALSVWDSDDTLRACISFLLASVERGELDLDPGELELCGTDFQDDETDDYPGQYCYFPTWESRGKTTHMAPDLAGPRWSNLGTEEEPQYVPADVGHFAGQEPEELGWSMRLTAPGYLDASEWSAFADTLGQARDDFAEGEGLCPHTGRPLRED